MMAPVLKSPRVSEALLQRHPHPGLQLAETLGRRKCLPCQKKFSPGAAQCHYRGGARATNPSAPRPLRAKLRLKSRRAAERPWELRRGLPTGRGAAATKPAAERQAAE